MPLAGFSPPAPCAHTSTVVVKPLAEQPADVEAQLSFAAHVRAPKVGDRACGGSTSSMIGLFSSSCRDDEISPMSVCIIVLTLKSQTKSGKSCLYLSRVTFLAPQDFLPSQGAVPVRQPKFAGGRVFSCHEAPALETSVVCRHLCDGPACRLLRACCGEGSLTAKLPFPLSKFANYLQC